MFRADFDHVNERGKTELFALGRRFREQPIAYSSAHGGFWIVSRYDDVVAVMMDAETFPSSGGITIPPTGAPMPVIPAESDGPIHAHYRAVMAPFLTPKALKGYEDKIRAIVSDALADIVRAAQGDAVADFAARIPARAMAIVFGFTDEEAYTIERDFSAIVRAIDDRDSDAQAEAVEKFMSFLKAQMTQRGSDPSGADIVSALLRYDAGDRKFTERERLGLLWTTAGAAIDTTKHAIGHAMYEIAVNKSLRVALLNDRALIPSAVEETLRFNAPAFMLARSAARPVSIGGADMRAGDRVLVVFGWANRDPAAFEDSEIFKVDRAPNRHVAFGHGKHQCIGMHLARLELKIALEEILAQIPDYELRDETIEPKILGGFMWSFRSIPIRLPQR